MFVCCRFPPYNVLYKYKYLPTPPSLCEPTITSVTSPYLPRSHLPTAPSPSKNTPCKCQHSLYGCSMSTPNPRCSETTPEYNGSKTIPEYNDSLTIPEYNDSSTILKCNGLSKIPDYCYALSSTACS